MPIEEGTVFLGCWVGIVTIDGFWLGFGLFDMFDVLLASRLALELLTSRFIMFGTLSTLFSLFRLSFERLLSRLGMTE